MIELRPDEIPRAVDAAVPSAWAAAYFRFRDAAGRELVFSTAGREFVADMLDDFHPRLVGCTGAQIGKSVAATARAFHSLSEGRDTLYVMPTRSDVSTFSAGRFAYSRDHSPRLRELFPGPDNVEHKVTKDGANLYFRGSHSASQLKSIPVALLVIDEFDEMEPEAIELARERLSAQEEFNALAISTPTLPGFGIEVEFEQSDRRRWHVPCHRCGQAAPFGGLRDWQESFAGDLLGDPAAVSWRCRRCGERWTQAEKVRNVSAGAWVAERPGAFIHGYHLPQLASPVRSAADFALRWQTAQRSEHALAQFSRAVLAVGYVAKGARLEEEEIADALRAGPAHALAGPEPRAFVTFGVDAGVNHHYLEIAAWDYRGHKLAARADVVPSFAEVERLARVWRPRTIVIDSSPNKERAAELQATLHRERIATVWLAFESESLMEPYRRHDEEGYVTLNRTDFLDRVFARFQRRAVGVPRAGIDGDYLNHHRSLLRIVDYPAEGGKPKVRYVSAGPDHFAFAAVFNEAALVVTPPAWTPKPYEIPPELKGKVRLDAKGRPVEILRRPW